MRKINVMVKVISLVLALSFITTQVSIAGTAEISSKDTLAPSLVSGNINPERNERVQNDVAKEMPGAIGNGKLLVDFMSGDFYPIVILMDAIRETKLRNALNYAITRNLSWELDSAVSKNVYLQRRQLIMKNLVALSNNLTKQLYLFYGAVKGPENYLLAFRTGEKVGVSVELVDKLSIEHLAQLLFHECASEHLAIVGAGGRRYVDREDHRTIYKEIQARVFGFDEVEPLKKKLRGFINEKVEELRNKRRAATTLKFPGTPALTYGSVGYEGLIAKIKANYSQPLPREALQYIRNIIQSKAPPDFFTDQEKEDLNKIVKALTGQISFQDLNLKLESPPYEGKPLHSIVVNLIDLKDEKIFRTNEGNFYQEITTYDEATGTLSIHIPKAFFEEYFQGENRSAITQAILHPLLEAIMGLSHQEAALALSFYNSDATIAAQGKVNISDVHRLIIKEAKNMAINGDKAAIRQLNALLNPDFGFRLTGADIQALKVRRRTIESLDTIRIHSEELARIINGLARGPIGRFDTKISLPDIAPLAGVEAGEMPPQAILDEYSLVTNATVAAALAVVADGYTGKMTNLTEKAEVKIIKDGADGLAKREMQVIFTLSGYRIIVTVSEGGLRDAVEESFLGGEAIGKKGWEVVSIALDVIEGTTVVAEGKAGGVSLAVSAKGAGTLLGNVSDVYAAIIAAYVPKEKIADFKREPLDPGPYEGEENVDILKLHITKQLTRIAQANNINLNQMEVVLLNRDRESVRIKVFKELESTSGLKVTIIEDGTFNHALKASLGGKGERLKVFFGTSGAPEAFSNVIIAKMYHKDGAVASARVLSYDSLKKAKDLSRSNAYNFSEIEQKIMEELRPQDFESILAGNKLFTSADVKGEPDAAITFITDNEVFDQPGVRSIDTNRYVVTTLRLREENGKAYTWIEERIALFTPLGTEIKPCPVTGTVDVKNNNIEMGAMPTAAQNVNELLNNIKDTVQITKASVAVTNPAEFRAKTVDYLAFESALNQNPDVKASAQYILRKVALSFNLKLASIHDFYMAKKEGKWDHITVPAVNGRADVYYLYQQLFRAAKEKNVGLIIAELARSEARYSAQDAAEFTAVTIASAIKQGYKGLIFAQGDHYQVNKEKFAKGGEDREKELKAIEKLIREAVLAGKYNIDIDSSSLVDDAALDQIVEMERTFVHRYLEEYPGLLMWLDENGKKALHRHLVDELEMGKIFTADYLTSDERRQIEELYRKMHKTSVEITMRFIRYIRALEKEIGLTVPISIGIEERHVDNIKHKDNPSTVLGSKILTQAILAMTRQEGLVGPSKLSLQTGAMHGVGGQVDFGIYQRHHEFRQEIGIDVDVQHGASTLEKEDFDKMRDGDVGEVHLATEYQKIELGIVAMMMPELAERMASYLEELMKTDSYKKFYSMWRLAHGDATLVLASIKEDDKDRQKKISRYQELAAMQSQKTRNQVIVEILGDSLPKGIKGTLKDLTKELPGPFKKELWNLPKNVRTAVDNAFYKEFSTILEKLGVTNTRDIIEKIVPFDRQPTILPLRPKALQEILGGITQTADPAQNISKDLPVRAEVFKANLINALSEHPDKTFVLGIDTDIGSGQQNRLQEIFNAVRQVESIKNATGERLFPNLLVRTNKAQDLTSDILELKEKMQVDLSNVFVVGKKANVDGNVFGAIAGEGRAWIAAVDDSQAGYAGYVPVFEAATLAIMAYLNAEGKADMDAIRYFYNAVAEKPVDPGMLQDMLTKRIIYILPKITNFETDDLKKLYELAAQVYIAA